MFQVKTEIEWIIRTYITDTEYIMRVGVNYKNSDGQTKMCFVSVSQKLDIWVRAEFILKVTCDMYANRIEQVTLTIDSESSR